MSELEEAPVIKSAAEMPEQQMTADEVSALTQLKVGQPKRHSTTPAVSDFTGISDNAGLLASLTRWHASGLVNGLVLNEAGGGIPHAWGLTRLGEVFQHDNIPVITSLNPNTAVHGGAAFLLTVYGSGFRSGDVIEANAVALTTTFVSPTQLQATYTPPATAGTVQFTVLDPVTNLTSQQVAFTVT